MGEDLEEVREGTQIGDEGRREMVNGRSLHRGVGLGLGLRADVPESIGRNQERQTEVSPHDTAPRMWAASRGEWGC